MKRHQVATTKLYGVIHILILSFAVLQIYFIIAQFFTYFHNPSIVCADAEIGSIATENTHTNSKFLQFRFSSVIFEQSQSANNNKNATSSLIYCVSAIIF